MNKEKLLKTAKIVALIYLGSFLIINWNDVSWVFNYKAMYGLVDDFFNPYPSIDASSIGVYFYPNHSQTNQDSNQNVQTSQDGQTNQNSQNVVQPAKEVKTTYTEKQNTLEIPKISISVPIIFSKSTEKAPLMKDLDLGVVYYPGSVYPGQAGQIVILGHSAPPGWPMIKHDWVFTDLNKLAPGDTIFIDLNSKQYTYIVKQKSIISKGSEVPLEGFSSNNVLTLISCWPPGKNYQRIAVQAELVE